MADFKNFTIGNTSYSVKDEVARQGLATKAEKSEMAISTSGDKTTITLKSGTSAAVLNAHQDVSGKANQSEMAVSTSGDSTTITLKTGTSATVINAHQDISGKSDKVVVVSASTFPSSLDPNKVYNFGTLTGSVTIPAFSSVSASDTEAKIWCFTFSTSTTAPTITWPAAITGWNGGEAPTINASKSYEVSVMDGIGVVIEN